MALDKFINSVRREVAKRFDLKTNAEIDAFFIGIEESARDKMLRDTVAELCEAKRLLQLAWDDIQTLNDVTVDDEGNCLIEDKFESCTECPLFCESKRYCGWRYQVDALMLIGETNDEP